MENNQLLIGKTLKIPIPPDHTLSTPTITSHDSSTESYLITSHRNNNASHHFTSSQLSAQLPSPINGSTAAASADPAVMKVKPRRGRPRKRKEPEPEIETSGFGNGEDCDTAGVIEKEEEDLACEVPVGYADVGMRKLGFDLNLDAEDNLDEQVARFDLNMGCDQVIDVVIEADENQFEGDLNTLKIGQPIQQDGVLSSLTVSNADSPVDGVTGVSSPDVMTVVDKQHSDDLSAYQSGTQGKRKRRQTPDSGKLNLKPVLRRSARKSSSTFSSSQVPSVYMFDSTDMKGTSVIDVVDVPSSNLSHNLTNQRSPVREIEQINPLITKLQLPESSRDFNLDGISMLNLISIYSFLRTFSTVLFLSPFELEDFCEALKCNSPTSLFDQTHVALLLILRKHLQFLSAEGSDSATDCLRSLNWDFLDSISWPLFITEYLLIMKPDFDIIRLNLVDTDYYNQPESLKVDILSILCDDLVDTECIRLEINRRSLIDELDPNSRTTNIRDSKRKVNNIFLGSPSSAGEIRDVTNDWNSDECCLCKLEGSLICCDGCPAAYHSRCVGVASDLLPDGDWYCPECNLDKGKVWNKFRVSIRGAESLGVDPDGRRYFGSCGSLLVFDSHEENAAISYYFKNDVPDVINILKSSDIRYGAILNAILLYWDVSMYVTESKIGTSSRIQDVLTSPKYIIQSKTLGSSEICSEKVVTGNGGNEVDSCNAICVRVHEEMAYQTTSSERSAEISQAQATIQLQNSENIGGYLSKGLDEISNLRSDFSENMDSVRGHNLNDSSLINLKQNFDSPVHARSSDMLSLKTRSSTEDPTVFYSNHYRLAQVASIVAEDVFGKNLDKSNKLFLKSSEESLSSQLKAIVKKSSRFCWSNIKDAKFNARSENCGWCHCCRTPELNMDCLFKLGYTGPAWKVLESQVINNLSKWRERGRGHLLEIISYVLFVESRLRGLLLGPWLNPQHSVNWSNAVLKSFDLASVKYALLLLESNLHHRAFSEEWSSYLDSVPTVGSASYAVTTSSCLGWKHGLSKKRGRSQHADSDPLPTSNAATDLDFFWWRGGRISRHVFCWKVLPYSTALKAARQAGSRRIPGIFYPEASEFAKRKRSVVWRAGVETSSTVEQLAFLIRELDSNIKWDDIENRNPFTKIDKKLMKTSRLFKRVIIRRKRLEGAVVKYLLDFGKRKIIPEIVVTHGSLFEESSSERKKYWMDESLVPVHMVKSFEENRIYRKNNKMNSGKHFDVMLKKGFNRPRDFSYLFSRAEKLEACECGHCKKSVPVRESVRCQFCEDYFHRRHARKCKGKDLAGDKYTCLKCHQNTHTKVEARIERVRTLRIKSATVTPKPIPQGKIRVSSRVAVAVKFRNNKADTQIPLRRSTRKIRFKYVPSKKKKRSARKNKFVHVATQKAAGRKRGRPAKTKKTAAKKVEDVTPRKKRRTQVQHSYWLNGLKLTRTPKDEQVVRFCKEKLVVPSEDLNIILNQPICTICSQFTSHQIYICCEVCEGWFHGSAFGVDAEKSNYIIGFRCHSCCNKKPPVCPVLL